MIVNKLEEAILVVLSQKFAERGEISDDVRSVTELLGKERQTPEDWIRLAENSIASADSNSRPEAQV